MWLLCQFAPRTSNKHHVASLSICTTNIEQTSCGFSANLHHEHRINIMWLLCQFAPRTSNKHHVASLPICTTNIEQTSCGFSANLHHEHRTNIMWLLCRFAPRTSNKHHVASLRFNFNRFLLLRLTPHSKGGENTFFRKVGWILPDDTTSVS
jgi:Ni,Fe-hydrogenase I cytochrome b subunit